MRHTTWRNGVLLVCVAQFAAATTAATAAGQDQAAGAGGSAGGTANIELGDVDSGDAAAGSGSASGGAGSAPAYASSDPGLDEAPAGSSDARLGIQARFDALNVLDLVNPIQEGIGPAVPIVTAGVRFVDGKLFLGLGLGLVGASNDTGGGGGANDRGQSGFTFSPLMSYDVVSDAVAALHLVGSFNIASLGEEEDCNAAGMCSDNPNSDADGLGLNLGAGIRGKLNEGLAIGGEFGWGFMSGAVGTNDYFNHGLFGTVLFEASVGL